MRLVRHWRFGFLLLVAVGAGAFLFLRAGGEEAPELSRTALVERAGAICAALARENMELPPPPVPYGALSEPFFQSFSDNVAAARERFEELNPPAADEEAVEDLVDALRLAATRAQEAAGAASVDQSSEVQALVDEVSGLATRADAAARRFGACAGEASFRISIGTAVRRKGENPLTETGTLG